MYWLKRKLKELSKCKEYSETYFNNGGKDLVPIRIREEKDGCLTLSFSDGTKITLMKDYTYQVFMIIQGEIK